MKTIVIVLLLMPFVSKSQIGFIQTVAGNGSPALLGDGSPATAASIGANGGIAFDKLGNYYFSAGNKVRKVSTTGIIMTVAGTGVAGYSGDGGPAVGAKLNGPLFIAFDTANNLYIGETTNSRVRKVNATTGIISTFAGTGIAGYSGDGGPATAADLNTVYGICIDTVGNLYLSDYVNNRIRKVSTSGIITTYAGTGTAGYSGDGGPATAAEIVPVYGICSDIHSNIYISDAARVRKIDAATGIISTVAGGGLSSIGGDGGPATAAGIDPHSIVMSPAGELYICEVSPNDVRKVDASGTISTVAGTGGTGFSGDGGPATAATLWVPRGVALDVCGNLFICDNGNYRIRKVNMPPILTIPAISLTGMSGASAGSTVTVNATVAGAGSSYLVHWMNHGVMFATTTVPSVTYTKPPGIDTITARVVSTASYGCFDSTTSLGHVVSGAATGMPMMENENNIVLYPNPANTSCTITCTNILFPNAHIAIYDLTGRYMSIYPLTGNETTISIASLPPGMYICRIDADRSGMVSKKLVVMR